MRDFLKYVLASFVAILLFAGVGVGFLIVFVTAIALSGGEAESLIEDQSILTLDLSVPIVDTPPSSTAEQIIGGVLTGNVEEQPLSLRLVLEALEAAAEDDRIVGLYIEGSGAASGFATLREVRQAVETFQAANKPVIAYDTGWNERSYYFVSVADQVMLNPNGLIEINGLSSEGLFFAGALEKYGIGVSAIRAGQYKSAVEPFTRSDRSPEEQAQTEELLGALWGEFLTTAGASRDLTISSLQAIVNRQGLLLPEEALEAGLIDTVAYGDEVLTHLHELTDEEANESSFRQVSLNNYVRELESDWDSDTSKSRIAIVYVEGNIVSGEGDIGQIGGDRFARILRDIRLDEEIAAVVLRVNSPGGSASAADKIAREVQLIQADKPVIVSMGNLAASGGYLIATHSQTIFASPNTITGSIGVFGLLTNFQDIANRNGITWDVVKTGEYADIGTVSRPPTEEELSIFQRFVNEVYDDFLQNVVESRPLSRAELEPIAQGRVWAGNKAQSLALIDELGGLNAAVAAAAAAADLGEDWSIAEYPEPRSFETELVQQLFGSRLSPFQHLYRQLDHPKQTHDPLADELQRVRVELETLRSLNDPRDIYTRLPRNYWIE
ncbi:MAG: signal peptide peptidase SppA [Cyanothece sp. SIO2G6]|nr:signal peptide peptidase SppA [Cyanothece sp. SIO2G6]